MDVGSEGGFEGLERVVAAEFEGSVDAHEDGLGCGALLGAVGLAVFAEDDGRTDHAFGEVVLERDVRLVQKREQVIARPRQTLAQPPHVRVGEHLRRQATFRRRPRAGTARRIHGALRLGPRGGAARDTGHVCASRNQCIEPPAQSQNPTLVPLRA